ncbi:MAG: hypothetical protein ACI9LM_000116 [Alteromonadaceae bacterium]|jgi:hypothetical protein
MEKLKASFNKARVYRQESSELSAFKAARKLELADFALDELELTIAGMLIELEKLDRRIEVLENENR